MNSKKKFVFLYVVFGLLFVANIYAERRMVAEWEPMLGTLIRWPLGIPQELVKELAEDDSLYVLVQNLNEESNALGLFSNAQVNLSNVRFIYAYTNSHWTRDWGPHSAFVNGELTIIDPIFDGYPWVPGRSLRYEDDNMVNIYLAEQLNIDLLNFPGYLTGGNFMSDGYTTAFSTQQMLDENLGLHTNDEFINLSSQLLGIDNYQFTINPEFHGIQHIDCWAKLLNEETVLVKQLDVNHPEYQRAETLATFFGNQINAYGNNYIVKRIFCANYQGNNAAAYTNSLILNKKVLVPFYNIPADTLAIQTYREAMPGYEVLGFSYNAWYSYDALHCRTMGIADKDMLRIEHIPQSTIELEGNILYLPARIKAYSDSPINLNNSKIHYLIQNEDTWQESSLVQVNDNTYIAEIHNLADSDIVSYYFEAYDTNNNHSFLPVNAPYSYFTSQISLITSISDTIEPHFSWNVYPNPFNTKINISTMMKSTGKYKIKVYNIKGQLVHSQNAHNHKNEIDFAKLNISYGVYFIELSTATHKEIKKVLFIK
ncbi:agmatine deiminase family protein [bacterium]|nr:agmatine deiminase family protein [bacterium]